MKPYLPLLFLFACLNVSAQEDPGYSNLLKKVPEVELIDSLHIDETFPQVSQLDSMQVKKWFSPILGSTKNNRLRNRNYFLAGKITTNDNFDLLVLMEEKKKITDSSNVQVVYLISTKKDGTYIASLEAAVAGIKKRSSYNTSSWLYKDNKIVLDSKLLINNEISYDDMVSYRINGRGRFILSGKDE
ncbi:MAG: hypothetical protein ABIT05_06030 [Chitinophagaceae bacterium]